MELFFDKTMPQNTARDFLSVPFRHKNKVLLVFLAILITVVIGSILASNVYRSEAKLFIRLGTETVHADSATGQRIQISQSMENQLNSELEILKSRELAERVVKTIGHRAFQRGIANETGNFSSFFATLNKKIKTVTSFPKYAVARFMSDPSGAADIEKEETEAAIALIIESLDARVINDSNIITLGFEADNSELARNTLDHLINIYLEKHIELHGSPGSLEFFQKESEKLRHSLEKAEADLRDLKNSIGIGDLVEQRSILSEQIGFLQREMQETESQMASSVAKIDNLKTRIENLPENVIVSETTGFARSAAEEMNNRIYELKLQEQELLSTFKPDSIPVTEVRRQIGEAETLLRSTQDSRQVTRGINPVHQELNLSMMLEKGNLEALIAKRDALGYQMASADEKLKQLNESEIKVSKVTREKELLEENYRKYAESLEQMRIDQAREIEKISNISVAQAPISPLDPIRPNIGLNMALGLFLAVFGGLGLAFFLEYIDDKFRKPEQIEKFLELPVLVSIQKLEV